MEITLPIDEDWEVRVLVAPDLSTVVIYNVQTDDEIRLEGSWDRLHLLGTVIAGDLKALHGDTEVTANGRNPDVTYPHQAVNAQAPTLDAIDAKIDNLEALLTDHRKGEERRYPDDMQHGDWVQFPPSHAWRQIENVTEAELHTNRVINYRFGGILYPHEVRAVTRYPYCPADRFAEVCDR